MLDRRNLLMSGAATAAVVSLSHASLAATAAASAGDAAASAKLNKLFAAFVNELLDHSPEGVTSLGLDKGPRAHQRRELGDRSLAEARRIEAMVASQLKRLETVDRNALNAKDQVGYDVVLYGLQTHDKAGRRYPYAGGN